MKQILSCLASIFYINSLGQEAICKAQIFACLTSRFKSCGICAFSGLRKTMAVIKVNKKTNKNNYWTVCKKMARHDNWCFPF